MPQDFMVSEWSGEKATRIITEPPGALYASHDFYFRLNSTTMELEESDLTSLPDYDRITTPIGKELSLTYDGSETPVILQKLECAAFDGMWETRSRGRAVDYNLMTRKGICRGSAFALIIGAGQTTEIRYKSGEQGRSVLLC